MSDLNQKLNNFSTALARLQEGALQLQQAGDLGRDGLIQRFEFTFELAWKALKACFEQEGLTGLVSPKPVLKEAYAAGLLQTEDIWLDMLADRNATAHIYSEQLAVQICQRIQQRYIGEFNELADRLRARVKAE